jgi:hypothetical protein
MIKALCVAICLAAALTGAWYAGRSSVATEQHAIAFAKAQRDAILGDCRMPCPIPEPYARPSTKEKIK